MVITVLLFLILKLKINAFVSLLIASMLVGILAGMPLSQIASSIQNGMAGALGFVATVVGLGAIFGKFLEYSGGAEALARHLLAKFGKERAPWALSITGFIVSIPVFFDVGLIILAPILYALSKDTKKSLLYYGIPLLAGMAVTHSFIPPTPGPIAVAATLGSSLGWVILFGFVIGVPTTILAGPVFGKYISQKIVIFPPEGLYDTDSGDEPTENLPSFSLIVTLIGVPLVLILVGSVVSLMVKNGSMAAGFPSEFLQFIGHPFTALIIATLLAMYFLCIKRGGSKDEMMDLSSKALGPAGIIILITGAGGVLKQMLVDTGMGKTIADTMIGLDMNILILGWLLAVVIRLTQGSATVAMITSAALIAPILPEFNLSEIELALLTITVAAGASIASHVNDSGFWLVSKYFGMNEKQTLQSWTVLETIVSVCGLVFALLIYAFV